MFFHKKELIEKEVKVDEPNPRFAQLLLEQFGGATGEISALLQIYDVNYRELLVGRR